MQPETYNFDSKNDWRKKIWNMISSSISVPERQKSIVLYLGGHEDLDRREAIEKGFHENNLILIEKDREIARRLREAKKTVIVGDLKDVLGTWPAHTEIGVVLADFCEGIDFIFALKFIKIFTLPAFWNTIFAFNFQRGREKDFNFWTKLLEIKKDLHRGRLFLDICHDEAEEIMHARFFSYKSNKGHLIFDSAIFVNPRKITNDIEFKNRLQLNLLELTESSEELVRLGIKILNERRKKAILEKMRRMIAASLAVRTRRSKTRPRQGLI